MPPLEIEAGTHFLKLHMVQLTWKSLQCTASMARSRKTAEILRKEFVLQGSVWDVQGGDYLIPNLSDGCRKAWGSVTV